MSARSVELNLLPKEVWEKGVLGQLLTWGLSVGRYVVVFTELVVISAFLYRFSLDYRLTDLRDSIKEKLTVITGFGDLEENFRLTQKKLTTIKAVSGQPRVLTALDTLAQMTPADAVFTNVTVDQEEVTIEGRVASQIGLATLLSQAQSRAEFGDVVLENIKSSSNQAGDIEFRLILTFKKS